MKLVFTDRELGKLFIMMMLAAFLFGIAGLVGMLVMQWVTRQRYAKEGQEKHGISQVNASRLGGAVIIGLCLGFLAIKFFTGHEFDNVGPMGIHPWAWLAFLSTSALGLVEDIDNDLLSPQLRLAMLGLFFGLTFFIWPEVIPNKTGYAAVDLIMSQPIAGWFIAVIFSVGFINAINMADGANGLVPGIVFIASIIFNSIIGALVWEVLSIVTGVFLLFNVISGRLFLGDAGAYGLGTVLVLAGFYSVNAGYISVEFAAVMMCYPCLEVVASMVRRKIAGRSMFKPDNYHLHNYIHQRLKAKTKSRVAANSLTGLLIAGASTGLAFVGYHWQLLAPTDSAWGWVFCLQVGVYLLMYLLLSRSQQATAELS
ncbi:MAG: Undecaprenyl-phosphate alpha-N-acetylglucosaminyl 1-phosphate transferase [Cellvibrionales bacterium UBA7375]|nr:MAG: Undecaprenyl-phosphate alpha-N-acetylglucosaminyl 1-phosphate transferase [Cellvibrionales bacterium UBA7375]